MTISGAGAATPAPLSSTTVVPPVEELLVMVSCPVAAPTVGGLNSTFGVTAWPGPNVSGNVAPEILKPVPFSVAARIVTGAVPVAVKVTDCVAGVFTITSPKATLLAFVLNTPAFSATVELRDPTVQAVMLTARKQDSMIGRAEPQRLLKGSAFDRADLGLGGKPCKARDI